VSIRKTLGLGAAWLGLAVFQFLVVLHGALAVGDYEHPLVSGPIYSPVRLPRPAMVALGKCGPVATFPLRHVVALSYRSNYLKWDQRQGWQGLVARVLFPFWSPDFQNSKDDIRLTRLNAAWFSALNSLLWLVGILGAAHLVSRWRSQRAHSAESGCPDDGGGQQPPASVAKS